ncbi:metallophosphoesterase [Paenibacillus contaminans]|uniref:Metallophosphoesterase n=1 Tax=Paenibacillus contaminans TaxID=450362 RepID=A0A329MLQ2_9BACL|nr:metallophosphoesterase [Paenibacillus contaminans]RAV20498.1 metallophosphoesterase [Paenibacillus contaminans]
MKIRTLLMIALFLGLFAGFIWYIGWNGSMLWHAFFPDLPAGLFWAVYLFVALGYLLAMLLRRALPYRVYTLIKLVGSYGLGVLFFCILLLPVADIAGWLLVAGGADYDTVVKGIGVGVVVLLLLLLLRGSWNAWSPVIRRYDIEIEKQAGSMRELRIAVASDLHLGTIVGKRHLGRLVERIEEMKPDLILLPGDVLDDSIEPFVRENMAEVLGRLQAPLGVYASLGNHEYIGGHIEEYVERMKAIDIEVLVDRSVHVADSFYVVGRKDYAAERFTKQGRLGLDELLADVDRTLPVIVLDHQPHKLGIAAQAGVDLMLSGHTHRGQMVPNHFITGRLFELDWGYLRKEAMHAIVSSGFGSWGPPLRLGSRSEVLDIRVSFGS